MDGETRTAARNERSCRPPSPGGTWLIAVCLWSLVSACGSAPTAPSEDATITIGPAGVVPAEVRIKAWGRVKFVNTDTRPHTMVSDPVETHGECPPVNQVGLLDPGESRTTGTLNLARVCGFHDHSNQAEASLKGRIIVQ